MKRYWGATALFVLVCAQSQVLIGTDGHRVVWQNWVGLAANLIALVTYIWMNRGD